MICSSIRLYGEGIAELLTRRGFPVVGTAPTAEECVRVAGAHASMAVLVDLAGTDGLAALERLATELPDAGIVALSVPEDEGTVIACAEAGATAYVSREETADDLDRALTCLALGGSACPPRLTAMLLRRLRATGAEGRAKGHARERVEHLTPREREVLRLMERGLSNKQIARELCIEIPTVKHHVHNILEKLDVRRRGEAVAWLHRAAQTATT
jgi:two-component system nitrate/nitrite response regulator NarL